MIRRKVAFFGPEGSKILSLREEPEERQNSAVIVCSPLHAEFVKNYRREVLLGQALAAQGHVVERFHYRGEGHSDGHSLDLSIETLVEDALGVADRLRDSTGITRIAWVGTRFGALVAIGAASRVQGDPIVLWDPLTSGTQYFREVFRARLMSGLKEGEGQSASIESLFKELDQTGWVEVFGYEMGRKLYASSTVHDLWSNLDGTSRAILLVQVGRRKKLRKDHVSMVDRMNQGGWSVTSEVVADEEQAWWFAGDRWIPDESRPGTAQLISLTTRWVGNELKRSRSGV